MSCSHKNRFFEQDKDGYGNVWGSRWKCNDCNATVEAPKPPTERELAEKRVEKARQDLFWAEQALNKLI